MLIILVVILVIVWWRKKKVHPSIQKPCMFTSLVETGVASSEAESSEKQYSVVILRKIVKTLSKAECHKPKNNAAALFLA